MNVERLTGKRGWCVLMALGMLAGSRTQLTCASTSAVLTGHTLNGVAFQGSDAGVPTGCSGE